MKTVKKILCFVFIETPIVTIFIISLCIGGFYFGANSYYTTRYEVTVGVPDQDCIIVEVSAEVYQEVGPRSSAYCYNFDGDRVEYIVDEKRKQGDLYVIKLVPIKEDVAMDCTAVQVELSVGEAKTISQILRKRYEE